jgi:hypothetical protein
MLTFVTAASSNHFAPLVWLLESVFHYVPEAQVVVFDLGLTDLEMSLLKKLRIEYRSFPFWEYPEYVSDLSKFAWKPLIIQKVLAEKGPLLWLDAGDQLLSRPDKIAAVVERDGVYTPQAIIGNIKAKTLSPTRDYLRMSEEIGKKRFRHAAVIGLHPRRQALVDRWVEAALFEEVIAPFGANRGNHHFDQSVLSILLYQLAEKENLTLENEWLDVSANNDDKRAPVLPSVSYQPLRT